MGQGPETSSSDAQPNQRCCLGLLYYSQLMQEHQKKPVCLGLKHTPSQAIEVDDRTQLGEGLTDYKFMCLGHSVYSQPAPSKSAEDPSSSSSSPAILPYCEGFEVIVAGQLEDAPAHHHHHQSSSLDRGEGAGAEGHPGSAATGGYEQSKLARYAERFVKVANRNLDRMQGSLTTAYNLTLKPFIDRLSDDS